MTADWPNARGQAGVRAPALERSSSSRFNSELNSITASRPGVRSSQSPQRSLAAARGTDERVAGAGGHLVEVAGGRRRACRSRRARAARSRRPGRRRRRTCCPASALRPSAPARDSARRNADSASVSSTPRRTRVSPDPDSLPRSCARAASPLASLAGCAEAGLRAAARAVAVRVPARPPVADARSNRPATACPASWRWLGALIAHLQRRPEPRADDDLGGQLAVVLADGVVGVELADRQPGGVGVTHARACAGSRCGTAFRPRVAPNSCSSCGADLPGVARALVDLRADDPQVAQPGVVVLADLLDGLHQHRQPGDREEVQRRRNEHAASAATSAFMVSGVMPGGQSISTTSKRSSTLEPLEAALAGAGWRRRGPARRARVRRSPAPCWPASATCPTASRARRVQRRPASPNSSGISSRLTVRSGGRVEARARRAPPARTADPARPAARARRARRSA